MLSLMPTTRRENPLMPAIFDRLFEGFPVDFFSGPDLVKTGVPAFNVYRDEGNFVVEASVPGYDKDDVTVEVDDNLLTITGSHREDKKEKKKDYYYREFTSGSFSRCVRLPSAADPGSMKAKFENGILKITMPDVQPEKKPHKITIE